jgi:hypothetical protein
MGFSWALRTQLFNAALQMKHEAELDEEESLRREQTLSIPPRSIDEYIDQHYAKLDERDQQQTLDADAIVGGGGDFDGAGTGGQD